MDKDKDMSRRRFLKMAALTGAAMCVGPTLNKVTAAERVWMGKQQVANNIPAGMAAVRTRRTLGHGNTAFTVSAMGYGCMGLNHNRSQYPSREKEIALVHEAVERGVTLFDTAESYGYHINEKLVGEALKGYTDRVFVSSKFGHKFVNGVQIKTEEDSTPANIRRVCENSLRNLGVETLGMFYQHRIDPNTPIEAVAETLKGYTDRVFVSSKFGHKFVNGVQIKTEEDSTPANIRRVCENSLRNLGVETLGMFYQHRIDPNTPIEAVAETCSKLIKEGKILHWGMCEVNVDTIRRAHKICPVTAIQSEYHLMHRMVETNGVLELCEDLGIGFVPYSPLNRGFLGGMINEYTKFDVTNDNRQTLPRFQPEAIRANYRIVEVLNAFGRTRGITPAQIALAWLMNKKPFIVPIPGTTKLSHLEENLRACDIRFTAEEIEELETAVAAIPVVGSRYDALQESKIPK